GIRDDLVTGVQTYALPIYLLFQQARQVAKRIRGETGLTKGKVSISSLAIDYLREVFDRFDNKTILVIGAGKIGELTLRQLVALKIGRASCRERGEMWTG